MISTGTWPYRYTNIYQQWTDRILYLVDVNIPRGEEPVESLSSIRVRVKVSVYPQNLHAIHTEVAARVLTHLAWSLPTCLEVTEFCS